MIEIANVNLQCSDINCRYYWINFSDNFYPKFSSLIYDMKTQKLLNWSAYWSGDLIDSYIDNNGDCVKVLRPDVNCSSFKEDIHEWFNNDKESIIKDIEKTITDSII